MHDSLVGTVVDGRYVITALVGRGGMATVYRARDKRLERDIALKLMHPHLAEKTDLNDRFNKEARAAAQLSDSHVVAIHDQGVWHSPDGSRAYLVMEYVPGPDLRTELQRLGSLPLGPWLDIVEQVLQALAAAHQSGIVHRDVKPENILLSRSLPSRHSDSDVEIQAKVADFGLAHVVDVDSVGSGTVLGTVAYIPPESISTGTFDPPADLYALGIMMYELLTGQLPFRGETPMQTAYMHLNDPMPRVSDKAHWMPAQVDTFIELFTQKNPEDRPSDGQSALEAFWAMKESFPQEVLSRRIPVTPTRTKSPTPVPAEAEEPHQEKTEIYTRSSLPAVSSYDSPTEKYAPVDTSDDETTKQELTTPATILPPELSESDDNDSEEGATSIRTLMRSRTALIVLLVALLAVVSTGAWYFFAGPGKRIAIPAVAGMTADEGEKALVAAGFKVTTKEDYSDDVDKGIVISTDPSKVRLRVGSTVTMTVSLGIEEVKVPKVVSLTRDEAIAELEKNHLKAKVTESFSNDVEKNRVISQSLEPDSVVVHDTTVALIVSKGREPVTLPTLTNMKQDEAVKALESVGLKAEIVEEFSETISKGTVISQNPDKGTVYRGDTITVTISKGPPVVEVPDVTSLTPEEARAELEAVGLKVEEQEGSPILFGRLKGKVYSQSPDAGKTVKIGSTVTIKYRR